jgi:hypothetical protein
MLITLLVILAGAVIGLGAHIRNMRLTRERTVHYQLELRSYTEALSPGATRKQVEDELRARGKSYERVYGFDSTKAYADLVKIGTEPAPWYCNKNNIHIKFAFDTADPGLNRISQADSDILRSIAVTPWLQDCL